MTSIAGVDQTTPPAEFGSPRASRAARVIGPLAAGLAMLSARMGTDMSKYPLDGPTPDLPLPETSHGFARAMLAKAKREGLARHIGVANFRISLIDEALELCPEPLVCLQAEYHPYLDQTKLLAHCRARGLAFVAYCPLGRGRLFDDKVLAEIAKAKGRTIAQVALRWLVQQNVASIPRSSDPKRIAENFDIFNFTLTDDEMKKISSLKRPDGRIANPVGRISGWD